MMARDPFCAAHGHPPTHATAVACKHWRERLLLAGIAWMGGALGAALTDQV